MDDRGPVVTERYDPDVSAAVNALGIRRVTHFTPSKNLPRILRGGCILSTAGLEANGLTYASTDPVRLDGHLAHVCCNIEFPNMYYFRYARERRDLVNFSDWCVILLKPTVLATPGTLFSPMNAAKDRGSHLLEGAAGLPRLYAASVNGNSRTSSHWPASPTDVQAEALIPNAISLSEAAAIVVPNRDSVRRERRRLELIGLDPDPLPWFTSDRLFLREEIRDAVRLGRDIPLTGPWEDIAEERA